MSDPTTGAGDVKIELDGRDYYLKPTLAAASALSRANDGLMGLVRKLTQFDFDTLVMVIAAGLGMNGQGSRDLPELVWKTGIGELSGPAIKYVRILANGGRLPSEDETGEPDPRVLAAAAAGGSTPPPTTAS